MEITVSVFIKNTSIRENSIEWNLFLFLLIVTVCPDIYIGWKYLHNKTTLKHALKGLTKLESWRVVDAIDSVIKSAKRFWIHTLVTLLIFPNYADWVFEIK